MLYLKYKIQSMKIQHEFERFVYTFGFHLKKTKAEICLIIL